MEKRYGLNEIYNCDINLCIEDIYNLKVCLEQCESRMTLVYGIDLFPLVLDAIIKEWETKIGKTTEECFQRNGFEGQNRNEEGDL